MAKNNNNTKPAVHTQYEGKVQPESDAQTQNAAGADESQPQAVIEVAAPKKTLLRAVYGTMIHPYVPLDIRTDAITEVDEVDSWLQSQIDEKKIVIV